MEDDNKFLKYFSTILIFVGALAVLVGLWTAIDVEPTDMSALSSGAGSATGNVVDNAVFIAASNILIGGFQVVAGIVGRSICKENTKGKVTLALVLGVIVTVLGVVSLVTFFMRTGDRGSAKGVTANLLGGLVYLYFVWDVRKEGDE